MILANEKNFPEYAIDVKQIEACDDPNMETFHITECLLSSRVPTLQHPVAALRVESSSEVGWISGLESKMLKNPCGSSERVKRSFKFCSCFATSKFNLNDVEVFGMSSILELLLEMEGNYVIRGSGGVVGGSVVVAPLIVTMKSFVETQQGRLEFILESSNDMQSYEQNALAYGMFEGVQPHHQVKQSESEGCDINAKKKHTSEKTHLLVSKCFMQSISIGLLCNCCLVHL